MLKRLKNIILVSIIGALTFAVIASFSTSKYVGNSGTYTMTLTKEIIQTDPGAVMVVMADMVKMKMMPIELQVARAKGFMVCFY